MSEEKVPQFTFEDDLPTNEEQTSQEVTEETSVEEPKEVQPNDDVLAIYNIYKDQGIIEEREDFDGTFESLHQAIVDDANKRQEQLVTSIFQSVPEFAQPLFELAINKGGDLTQDDLKELIEISQAPSFTKDDLSNDEKAAQFLTQVYMREYEEDEEGAAERIDLLRDRDRLQKEATKEYERQERLRSELIDNKVQEAKALKEQREQAQRQFQQSFVQNLQGLEWQDKRKQVVQEELFSGNFKQRVEHIMQNPAALAQLIDFMSYYDGDNFDLSAYQKQAFSPSNKKVKDQVQKYWSGNRSKSADPESMYEDMKDLKFDIN